MKTLKARVYEIVFEADTRLGKWFDITLIVLIAISILAVMLESVESVQNQIGSLLKIAEWIITIIFTIEYLVRLWVVKHPKKFVLSFYGIIDLLSFLPTYIGLVVVGTHGLMVIRALRMLRIFRILKLNRYISESNSLIKALVASKYKISIFLYAVLMLIIIIGAVMYLVEGKASGFDSIPRSMYWVIVTITTVGFGDITPQTTLGQFVASFIMILGYAIIAVPTGIVSSEIGRIKNSEPVATTQCCPNCLKQGHTDDAKFCKFCGTALNG